jgi:SPOR domain
MKALIKLTGLVIAASLLAGCNIFGPMEHYPSTYRTDPSYDDIRVPNVQYRRNSSRHYYRYYGNRGHQRGYHYSPGVRRAPGPSYHFANGGKPVNHKERDVNWIRSQSPEGYTIELASDKKPASVAKTIHKSPKDARRAQFRTYENGEATHRGVYGSYQSREAAQKALKKLPANVRGQAQVKQWQNLQGGLKQKSSTNGGGSGYQAPEPSTPASTAIPLRNR